MLLISILLSDNAFIYLTKKNMDEEKDKDLPGDEEEKEEEAEKEEEEN